MNYIEGGISMRNSDYLRRRAQTKRHNRKLKKAIEFAQECKEYHSFDDTSWCEEDNSFVRAFSLFTCYRRQGTCCLKHNGFWDKSDDFHIIVTDWDLILYGCACGDMIQCRCHLRYMEKTCFLEIYLSYPTSTVLYKNGAIHVPVRKDICAIDEVMRLLNR